MSPTDRTSGPRASAPGRSLVTEVLTAQLAITALVGVIALIGLAWTSASVIRDNLAHWASQWAAELDELGAPFYVRDTHDALLGVERFVSKYPEIDRVTWYRPNGEPVMALDQAGPVRASTASLDAGVVTALTTAAGATPPHLLTEDLEGSRRFRLVGPIWTEALAGDGLIAFDPLTSEASVELLGFVSVDLDFSSYTSAFFPRLALASAVLLFLLGAAWACGRLLLKHSLAPLSQLEQPLMQLAAGETEVQLPTSRHKELHAIVTVLDDTVEALQKRERHLVHLANHDPLTGLFNRHRLIAELEAEIARCEAQTRRSALLFIDLDQFKYINDTCGHAAGDQLLKLAAEQLRYAVRSKDFVARFGGDEFVVLLKNVTRRETKMVATQVLDLMRSLKHVEQDHVFNVQCSIGIATVTSGRFNTRELIAQADMACQTAKAHGRNRLEFYSVSGKQSERMARDVQWMRSIREALERDAFVLHYQPLLHIRTGTVSHYEALLRLTTERGLVGPQTFLPAATRFGLMAEIDSWVIARAVRALAELGAADRKFRLSINLSSFAFEDEGLAGRVRSLLKDHDVSGDRIVFEITEQLAVRFAANTDKQIAMLRDLGCRLAVDDFGTGYSSFSYLKRLPVDYLKIDGSFIRGLARDRVDQSMVRMVGEVARAAGMETVAEYVQSAAALALLERYGIDYAQGSYVGAAAAELKYVAAESSQPKLPRRASS